MSAYGYASVTINQADIDRLKNDFLLMGGEVPLAQSRIINRSLSAVNTEGSVQVRKYYNLKASRIKKNFKVQKATKNNLNGYWRSTGRPVGLMQFGAKETRRGVSVKVSTEGSRSTVRGAFIRTPSSPRVDMTGPQVFWRAKDNGVIVGRYPLERKEGPRIEDALKKPKAQAALQKKADDTIQKRLEVESNYILSKAK